MEFKKDYHSVRLGPGTEKELKELLNKIWDNKLFLNKEDFQILEELGKRTLYPQK